MPSRRLLALLDPIETSTTFTCKIGDGHYARIRTLVKEVGPNAAKAYIQKTIYSPLGTKKKLIDEVTIVRCGVDPWRGENAIFKLSATLRDK